MGHKKCSISGCTKNSEYFYTFPHPLKDRLRFLEWFEACQNESLINVPPRKIIYKTICAVHFEWQYFLNRKLTRTAVPTLHLPGNRKPIKYCGEVNIIEEPNYSTSARETGTEDPTVMDTEDSNAIAPELQVQGTPTCNSRIQVVRKRKTWTPCSTSSRMAEVRLSNDEGQCTPAKQIKIQTENASKNDDSIHDSEICLSNFEVKKVLQNNYTRKQIYLEGVFKGRENSAVVLLEKKTFPDEQSFLAKGFFNADTKLRKSFRNDVYGNYECFPTTELNGLNATIIHPATPKHIEKFKRKELYIINETYELYQKVTVPYIESSSFSIEWIHNILEHKAEQENVLYEDKDKETGFMMVNDLKWDGQAGTLKLIALPFKNIRCIRELNASHLPLLKNIRDSGCAIIAEKFNISASRLRIYIHYQPSYYYLHVHFANLMTDTPGIYVEKAHLLSTVISNIELMPDYYTKAVLSYVVAEGEPLFTKFQEQGIVGEATSKTTEV